MIDAVKHLSQPYFMHQINNNNNTCNNNNRFADKDLHCLGITAMKISYGECSTR